MKPFIIILLLTLSLNVSAGMLLPDGSPRPVPYTIAELTKQCDFKGYFVYGDTIYMCVKIRENVPKEEFAVYHKADIKRQIAKRNEQDARYKKWIKTDEGKAWQTESDRKLKEKKAKDHK